MPNQQTDSYVNEPLQELLRSVPELETLQPATDQGPRPLSLILENTGRTVDEFFERIVGVIADEEIIEKRPLGEVGKLRVHGSYLIISSGPETQRRLNEYRMDAKGNRMEGFGLREGYIVTFNFALEHIYFSPSLQSESTFKYLGQQKIGMRDTYVVAFSQNPGEASIFVTAKRRDGTAAHLFVQGIAWVDKQNFQILRMRTDLLAPRDDINFQLLTTTVVFDEVRLPDLAVALWLPSAVHLYVEADGQKFDSEHRYTNYRRYSVSVKMLPNVTNTAPTVTSDADLRESPATTAMPKDISPPWDKNDQSYYANAHPYLEEPSDQLIKQIPELKTLQPASDQRVLPMILSKTAVNVDNFIDGTVDLLAHEQIRQEQLSRKGYVVSSQRVKYNYLILHHRDGRVLKLKEYRTDRKNNRLDQVGLVQGYSVTSGFALICAHFASNRQSESTFRFVGTELIGNRSVYVVAFAQLPGKTTISDTVSGPWGKVNILVQGLAWIDKSNFQIIRIRTDLLAPRTDVGLDQQTTVVTYSHVKLRDVESFFWLPSEVTVYTKCENQSYRNEHHYTNYQRFRVSTKMVTSQ